MIKDLQLLAKLSTMLEHSLHYYKASVCSFVKETYCLINSGYFDNFAYFYFFLCSSIFGNIFSKVNELKLSSLPVYSNCSMHVSPII